MALTSGTRLGPYEIQLPLYDVGHQDGIDFLVMEFLEDETLDERLRKGPLPIEQVLRDGIEICERLELAHKSGVVHRRPPCSCARTNSLRSGESPPAGVFPLSNR